MTSILDLYSESSKYPIAVDFDPLLVVRIRGEVDLYYSEEAFRANLDDSLAQSSHSVLLTTASELSLPLRKKSFSYNFLKDEAFELAFWKEYPQLCKEDLLLRQSRISMRIIEEVESIRPDIVVLVMVDGLSFRDWLFADTEPCLVDVVSMTANGMKNILGDKLSLSTKLSMRGYINQYGFTYWAKDSNELTTSLFIGMDGRNVWKVKEFGELIEFVPRIGAQSYVQIIRTGYDQYVHDHRDAPPLESIKTSIMNDLEMLSSALQKTGLKVLVFLTSDHGIIWRSDVGDEVECSEPRCQDTSSKNLSYINPLSLMIFIP